MAALRPEVRCTRCGAVVYRTDGRTFEAQPNTAHALARQALRDHACPKADV